MPRTIEDLTGRAFGHWTVLGRAVDAPRTNETIWLCQCSCGTQQDVPRSNLTRGRSTKCMNCRAAASRKPPRPKVRKVPRSGPTHHLHKGDRPGYSAAHSRVTRARGRARDHQCILCDAPATSWAYRGGSAKELKEWRETSPVKKGWLRYSPDPADYDPLCWSCHARKDVLEARAREQ